MQLSANSTSKRKIKKCFYKNFFGVKKFNFFASYLPKFNIAKPFLLQYHPVCNFNLRYCVLQSQIFLKGIKYALA